MTSQTIPALSVFRNEPLIDFSLAENKSAMTAAINKVQLRLGQKKYPLVIAGRAVDTDAEIVSHNPAHPEQVIARHATAGPDLVPAAVDAAMQAFSGWSSRPVEERMGVLLRAAAAIRSKKMEISAWLVLEVGKSWAEADADTAETIDFLEFYAREALRLARAETPIQYPGEKNELAYLPLGVGAVIPPWNFPLAIMAGMTVAAIVTGNTVVLKPSPLAPTIAAKFLALLEECGLPPGVVNLCQGGVEFGSALVEHPQIRFIAFTGSKKVGLDIHLKAANVVPGQHWIKRTVLELGGKDAIIVEADADLEMAADGVVASAFGFSGQKCSACSRVIVNEMIHDEFVELLKERILKLSQGDPASNHAVGPVISEEAYHRILQYLEEAKQQGQIVTGGSALTPPEKGYYIAPTLITGLPRDARICQEEIFGPVLAVIASQNFDDALAIANSTEYGLTGSVYSRSEDKLAQAHGQFHVGNLYFNRKCTGAMVGAHPFGGFNMSGTDSKAGGADYLLLFTQAKSVARRLN